MDEIEDAKRLMRKGRVSEAEVVLLRMLKENPVDVQAKMLYGICCQANGDYESFCRIGDAENARMESGDGIDEKHRSLWKRYCKIGLLVAGVGTAVAGGVTLLWGDSIAKNIRILYRSLSGDVCQPVGTIHEPVQVGIIRPYEAAPSGGAE